MNWRAFFLTGLFIVAIDQVSKRAVIDAQLPYVFNNGFSFGLWQGVGVWAPLILLCVVAIDAYKQGIYFPDVLILAGGISNMIDRLSGQGVIDWIRFFTIWFNIADISITIGVLWIVVRSSLRTKHSL